MRRSGVVQLLAGILAAVSACASPSAAPQVGSSASSTPSDAPSAAVARTSGLTEAELAFCGGSRKRQAALFTKIVLYKDSTDKKAALSAVSTALADYRSFLSDATSTLTRTKLASAAHSDLNNLDTWSGAITSTGGDEQKLQKLLSDITHAIAVGTSDAIGPACVAIQNAKP